VALWTPGRRNVTVTLVPGRIPAPDGIRLLLLQDHVIADDGGKFEFRAKPGAEGERQQDEKTGDFHFRVEETSM
jgi:hypothetical protein